MAESYAEYLKRKGMKSSGKASEAWRKATGRPPAKPYKPVKYDKRNKKVKQATGTVQNLIRRKLQEKETYKKAPKGYVKSKAKVKVINTPSGPWIAEKITPKKKVDRRGGKKIKLLNPDGKITRKKCNNLRGTKTALNEDYEVLKEMGY